MFILWAADMTNGLELAPSTHEEVPESEVEGTRLQDKWSRTKKCTCQI